MIQIPKILRFLLSYVVLGLAIAFVALAIASRSKSPASDAASQAPADVAGLTVSYAQAVEQAAPSVVNIYVNKIVEQRQVTVFNDPQLKQFAGRALLGPPRLLARRELGSGVIVSEDGLVLTNYHVIRDADDIQVSLWDGRITEARVAGFDEETDLAVLRIDLQELPSIPYADAQRLRVGDVVLAIGNPFGLGKTVTMGIVSATGRSDLHISTYENFIQTDAAINRGNSGGALVNSRGELVGINTAMFERAEGAEGIGFAIPIDMGRTVMRQILEHGRVIRGWLGVETEDGRRFPRLSALAGGRTGIVIAQVYPGGPGERAGLQPYDFLTRFDGQPIGSLKQLLDDIAGTEPGTPVTLEFWRGGQAFQTTARLIQRPPRLGDSG